MPIRRPRASKQSRPAAEQLEIRVLPTVTATLSRGLLTLQGDQSANDITIEQSGADLVITGNNGTTIRYNGSEVAQATISGVQHLKGMFGAKNDKIEFDTGVQLGNVTLNLGSGSNDVEVRETTITGMFSAIGGNSRDRVEFDASTLNNITLNLGNGNDEVEFLGSTVNGAVLINMSNGIDLFQTNEGQGGVDNTFQGLVSIKAGNQADEIELRDATFTNLGIDAGADGDEIVLDTINVTGRFGINAGSGNDEVTIDGVTQTGTGMNSVVGGSGIDEVDFKSSTFNSFVDVDMGSGPNNELEIDDVHFNSLVSIFSNGQNDQVLIEQDLSRAIATEFVGALSIQMGPGGTVGIGTSNAASWTQTSAGVVLKGTKPSLIATVTQLNVAFNSDPLLKNAQIQLV